eukprot:s1246_g29.t1
MEQQKRLRSAYAHMLPLSSLCKSQCPIPISDFRLSLASLHYASQVITCKSHHRQWQKLPALCRVSSFGYAEDIACASLEVKPAANDQKKILL